MALHIPGTRPVSVAPALLYPFAWAGSEQHRGCALVAAFLRSVPCPLQFARSGLDKQLEDLVELVGALPHCQSRRRV